MTFLTSIDIGKLAANGHKKHNGAGAAGAGAGAGSGAGAAASKSWYKQSFLRWTNVPQPTRHP